MALFFCRAKFTSLIMRDGLAQLVERLPSKQDAAGSSPVDCSISRVGQVG